MNRLIIKIKINPQNRAIDLEISGKKSIEELTNLLVKNFGLPNKNEDDETIQYWFETQNGPINPSLTFPGADIRDGDLLWVRYGATLPEFEPSNSTEKLQSLGKETIEAPIGTQQWRFGFEEFSFKELPNASSQERRASIRLPSAKKKSTPEV